MLNPRYGAPLTEETTRQLTGSARTLHQATMHSNTARVFWTQWMDEQKVLAGDALQARGLGGHGSAEQPPSLPRKELIPLPALIPTLTAYPAGRHPRHPAPTGALTEEQVSSSSHETQFVSRCLCMSFWLKA